MMYRKQCWKQECLGSRWPRVETACSTESQVSKGFVFGNLASMGILEGDEDLTLGLDAKNGGHISGFKSFRNHKLRINFQVLHV